MIAIFVDGGAAAASSNTDGVDLDGIMLQGVKPVRRAMGRKKKQAMMKARGVEEDIEFDIQEYVTVKTDHEKARIGEAIKASFLFQNISPSARETLLSVMEKVRVKKGDWVIKQGDEGDKFYIVDNGTYAVFIQDIDKIENNGGIGDGGACVHQYKSGAHPR